MQGIVGCGLDQAAELVIAIVGLAQVAFDLGDVACCVVLVEPAHEDLGGLVGCRLVGCRAGFDFDAAGSLQRIVAQGLAGPRCADLRGHHPAVVAVADLALVGQGDFGQTPGVVVVALRAAIGVGMALQLAVGIEALACWEAEAAAVHLAVGDAAVGRSALSVSCVAGAADQGTLSIHLLIALELAVFVMLVTDLLVGLLAAKLVLFQHHP